LADFSNTGTGNQIENESAPWVTAARIAVRVALTPAEKNVKEKRQSL
jgi:hypothetical protein